MQSPLHVLADHAVPKWDEGDAWVLWIPPDLLIYKPGLVCGALRTNERSRRRRYESYKQQRVFSIRTAMLSTQKGVN